MLIRNKASSSCKCGPKAPFQQRTNYYPPQPQQQYQALPHYQPQLPQPTQNSKSNQNEFILHMMERQKIMMMSFMQDMKKEMMNEIENLKRDQPDQRRGKGVEINSHKGWFPTQPLVNIRNISLVDCDDESCDMIYDETDFYAEEEAHVISKLSGKELLDPYKKLEKEEIKDTVLERNEEEEAQNERKEPQPSKYQPPIPFPSVLNFSKPSLDHEKRMIDAFKSATVTFHLDDVLKCVLPISKYVKNIFTLKRSQRKVQLF